MGICFVLLVGVPITAGIVHYEWYGGDPQKRSLANRFLSNGAITISLAATAILTFVGLLRYNVCHPFLQLIFFKLFWGNMLTTFWFGNLVIILRLVQVFVWKRVKEINEDLLNRAVSISVFSISVCCPVNILA